MDYRQCVSVARNGRRESGRKSGRETNRNTVADCLRHRERAFRADHPDMAGRCGAGRGMWRPLWGAASNGQARATLCASAPIPEACTAGRPEACRPCREACADAGSYGTSCPDRDSPACDRDTRTRRAAHRRHRTCSPARCRERGCCTSRSHCDRRAAHAERDTRIRPNPGNNCRTADIRLGTGQLPRAVLLAQ